MTARDEFNEMKFEEAEARGRKIQELLATIEELDQKLTQEMAESARLRAELNDLRFPVRVTQSKKPPVHEGQMRIGE